MIGREERRDRFEYRVAKAKEWWMNFEDSGIALVNDATSGMKSIWELAQQWPQILRWAIVFGSVLVSIVIGLSFRQNVTAPSQLLLLLPAVLVSGLYGGMFAGTVAALLGAVLTVFLKVHATPATFGPEFVGLVLYAIACGIVLSLCRAQEIQRAQILQFTETLEGRVKERTADLESANRELMDFCYSISHDIRAPMRNIVSSSKMLLEDVGPNLDLASKQKLHGLANSANKLATWVDDLLRYAKLGRTEIKPEWVNVTQIVDEITAHLADDRWAFSSVTVRVHPNLVTTGDRVLVRMALWNLLENAYKYAQKDRPLIIEVGQKMSKNVNYIAVRDNGIGFEQQYAKKIFEPFQRLHREDEYPGSGIGLANTKRIVERHGGEIMAEGVPMVGSTFLIRFGSGKTEGRAIIASAEE